MKNSSLDISQTNPLMKLTSVKSSKEKLIVSAIVLTVLIFVLGIGLSLSKSATNLGSKAAGTGTVFFTPTTQSLPPDATLMLQLDSRLTPVVFAHIEVNFDPTKVQLVQNVQLSNPKLTRVVVLTPSSEANTVGKVKIALGLDPLYKMTPPVGTIDLASLKFKSMTQDPNTVTNIIIDGLHQQIVGADSTTLGISTQDATLTLNPQPSPSPAASPSPIASIPPSPSASPSPIASILPSPSASPSSSPQPSTSPLPISVTITNPLNNSTVRANSYVNIVAATSPNITKVEFLVNNSLKCADVVVPFSCSWKVPGKQNVLYKLTAKAYDSSGNTSLYSIFVTSKRQ